MNAENELRYFDALRRIANCLPAKAIKQDNRTSSLEYVEYLEMAYDNVRQEAKNALGRRRRPVPK